MIEKLLTFKDYKEIVDHCMQCKGSYAIKDFINDLLKNYGDFNSNLELNLMEFIANSYKDITFKTFLAPDEFVDFSEDIPDHENAALGYLYSYLIYLAEVKIPISESEPTNGNTQKSFRLKAKYKPDLIKLLNALNDDIDVFSDDRYAERFAEILTAKDLNELNEEEKTLYFECRTTEIATIIDLIKDKFNIAFNDHLINDCRFYTKNKVLLNNSNIQKSRSTVKIAGNRRMKSIKQVFDGYNLN